MKAAILFRLIGGVMLAVAAVFLIFALTHPELGTVFSVGGVEIGSAVWRALYIIYAAVAAGLLAASFFMGKRGE